MVIFTPYEAPDNFTSMPYPRFEPGTFGVAVGLIREVPTIKILSHNSILITMAEVPAVYIFKTVLI